MVPSGPRNSWAFGNNDNLNIIMMMVIMTMMIMTMMMTMLMMIIMMMITWAFGIRTQYGQ